MGGAHRAHAAGVEGRLLARPARRRPGDRRARPVGLPAAVGRPPAARRARRRQRDVRAVDARLRRHQRGPAGRDRHAAGRRAAPPPGARRRRRARPAARSSSSTSPGPTRCGTAATSTTSASGSASSSPPSRRSTPTSSSPCPTRRSRRRSGTRRASGMPFNDGLIKNRYIGRTFIEPTQEIRDRGVALKFNALAREPGRQAGRDDRRLAGARHHRRPAGQAGPRRRRDRGARADHVPADHPPVPLRRRHGPRRRPDGGPPDASTRSASRSAPTASSSCRSTG